VVVGQAVTTQDKEEEDLPLAVGADLEEEELVKQEVVI
jgi:hypothetical protein